MTKGPFSSILLFLTFFALFFAITVHSTISSSSDPNNSPHNNSFIKFTTGTLNLDTTRIDFDTIAATPQYTTLSLVLIHVNSQYTNKWSKVFNPFIVDYIPEALFLLHALPSHIHQLILSHNLDRSYKSAHFFPHVLKLSSTLQKTIAHDIFQNTQPLHATSLSPSPNPTSTSFLSTADFLTISQKQIDDIHHKVINFFQQDQNELNSNENTSFASFFANPSLFSDNNVNKQLNIDNTLSQVLKDSFSSHHRRELDSLYLDSPTFDHFSQHTAGIQYTNTKSIIAAVSSLFPPHLQVQERYLITFSALSNLLHNSTTHLYNHISNQFTNIFTSLSHNNFTRQDETGLLHSEIISSLFSTNKQSTNINLSHNSLLTQRFYDLSTIFDENKLSPRQFVINYFLHQKGPQCNQSNNTIPSLLQSLLPFHLSIATTSMARFINYDTKNSLLISKPNQSQIGSNIIKFQMQSPLFISNPKILSDLISMRTISFYSMIQQLYIQQSTQLRHHDVIHCDSARIQAYVTASKQLLTTLTTLREQLFSQYDTYIEKISTISNDSILQTNTLGETKPESHGVFQQYIADIAALPTFQHISLQKHIDIVLFSLAATHISQQIDDLNQRSELYSDSTISSPTFLSASSFNTLVTSFISLQKSMLSHLHTEILELLSTSPHIHHLDLISTNQLENNIIRSALHFHLDNIPVGQQKPQLMTRFGPYKQAGVDGTGITMAVSDSGLDAGSCFFRDDTNPTPYTGIIGKETESLHRKIKSYLVFADDREFSANGHGTHVCGTIVGSCIDQTQDIRISSYNGHLPNSKIAFFDLSLLGKMLSLDNDLVIFEHAKNNGAMISSNSWASSRSATAHIAQSNGYNYRSLLYDAWTAQNHDFLILFPSSNYGETGISTLSVQANAKNPLIVGATQAGKAGAVKYFSVFQEATIFTQNPSTFSPLSNLAYFSATGPTIDGRIAPQVVAPGTFIFSASSTTTNSKSCNHQAQSGTSMATPAMAGLAGMVQQMLQEGRINQGTANPQKAIPKNQITGPLLKSLLITAARPLKYQSILDASAPLPLWRQTKNEANRDKNGQTWSHQLLGSTFYQKETLEKDVPQYIYVDITPTLPDEPQEHAVKFIAFTTCPSNNLQFFVYSFKDAQDIEPIVTTQLQYEPYDTANRKYFEFKLSAETPIAYIKIVSTETCAGTASTTAFDTYPLIFSVHEYSHGKIDDSNNHLIADCMITADRLPQTMNSFVSPNQPLSVSCPPAPSCTDYYMEQTYHNTPQNLWGGRTFSIQSSICRAALFQGAVNATNWILQDQAAEIEVKTGKRQIVNVEILPQNVYEGAQGVKIYGVTSETNIPGFYGQAFQLKWAGDVITAPLRNTHLYLKEISPTPNTSSGYGLPMLSSIFPLTQYALYTEKTRLTGVQRQIALLSQGQKTNALSPLTSHSYCFMVSSQPLVDIYQYNYPESDPLDPSHSINVHSEVWTSGPDSLRVTLSYYDQPGPLNALDNARLLINDIDLFLFGPSGEEQRGNQRADRLNNNEMVDLLPGTFLPGMYCAVVHGVNIPIDSQRYALVANGRGIEQCQENPLPIVNIRQHWKEDQTVYLVPQPDSISGIWTRGSITCQGETSPPHDEEYDFDILKSKFHYFGSTIQIRQGGDCFSIHEPVYTEPPKPYFPGAKDPPSKYIPHFNAQRLSKYDLEQSSENYQQDQYNGKASQFTAAHFVLSGKIKSDSTFSGETYRDIPQSSTQSTHHGEQRDEMLEILSTMNAPIDANMLLQSHLSQSQNTMIDGNILYTFNGHYDSTKQSLHFTLIHPTDSQQCSFQYKRSLRYPDVQYNTNQVNAIIADSSSGLMPHFFFTTLFSLSFISLSIIF